MMSLWDALRMNMMISYQELVRTFLRLYGIRSPAMECRDVETKIQIYPCKHLPPFFGGFFLRIT